LDRSSQYPGHLAKLVAGRLRGDSAQSPPEVVLTRMLETLYFASLKTDEGRPILCTVNYVDPDEPLATGSQTRRPADHWTHVPFDRPLPFDVRTLMKLARAVDPAVSSLAVFRDKKNRLFIWGMVDQEPRISDYIVLNPVSTPPRPGLFQATITGVGNISVYQNDTLIGSLEQNTLVEEYHDVLWSGPVHDLLAGHLQSYLLESPGEASEAGLKPEELEPELRMRWLNSICRILMNIQRYRHGGGLLIAPQPSLDGLNVKYTVRYDRLLQSLRRLVEAYLTGRSNLALQANAEAPDVLPIPPSGETPLSAALAEHKKEVLGAVRFIASLSCVDGFVLLDRYMVVHGFGVEVRTDNLLSDIYVARDSHADPKRMRLAELTQYGTRHRAMMRYCFDKPGTLGLVVSQDGDIRAMTRVEDMLVLWENIDVQLGYKDTSVLAAGAQPTLLRRVSARVA
jgi:hypothetical protein